MSNNNSKNNNPESNTPEKRQLIEQQVKQWLEDVVIGLNLCPFAAKPNRNKQIRIFVSEDDNENDLLETIYMQFKELDETPPETLETILVVAPFTIPCISSYPRRKYGESNQTLPKP